MLKLLGKWLKVYQDELALLFWSVLILFLIRSSSILFNNFAETAFLKRYGVEYLPIVYVVNSISTFVIMGFMTGFMNRLPGSRLLTYLFLFCGSSVAGLRFIIPLAFDLLYPVLFVLKSQYEVLLALVFWNLANDLFNTRQSKRLFPLITAGGVLGGIIGSFATPLLEKAITMDNLMLAYLGTTAVGAIMVKRMGGRFPTLLLSDKTEKKTKSRVAIADEFRKVLPLIKESKLVQILIMLTLMPNVVIPIINYQFNFAVDQTFATEGKMISFFAYFNGSLNIISLIILMFVGRIYGRWGLPIALMFHPFNYVLAFLAFLLRFDIFSAMYARISTNVLRTTINNPARNILMGLFPESYRGAIRPFLRGTVVRIGVLAGAGFIMLSERLVHPRYLSVVAVLFVGGWILATFSLKRGYSRILLDLISRNILDLKSMGEGDVSQIFKVKEVQSQLVQSFSSARGDECLWYARLLKSLGVKELDVRILSALREQDDQTRVGLLSLLSSQASEEAIEAFRELADPVKPELTIALLKASRRLPSKLSLDFNLELFENTQNPEVKAHAVVSLYHERPQKYKEVIDSWLAAGNVSEKRAGIIAAGYSEEHAYAEKLKEILEVEQDEGSTIPLILEALHRLGTPDLNVLTLPYLSHPLESIRLAALEAFEIENDDTLRTVIALLGDPSDRVHELAKEKLHTSSYQNAQLLVESLTIPRRKVREGIFYLLETMNIKDVDVFRAARFQLERAYRNLAESEAVRQFPESRERDLLVDHLNQKRMVRLDNALRILSTQDRSGQMRTIWRGISSANVRQRSNSLEALDDVLDASLSRIMMPLVEDLPPSECLAVGRKKFQLPNFDSNPATIYAHLLGKQNWITVVLTLYLVANRGLDGSDPKVVERLASSENTHIRQLATAIVDGHYGVDGIEEDRMETETNIPEKILHLRRIQIFEGLSVSELAAVASVTDEVTYQPGETVIKEGEAGDTMYLIIKGEVSVNKDQGDGRNIELDRIGAGDYFGEMALFEDILRSATIRTEAESRLLVLHKREFTEIVREYPQIALHICKVLGARLRKLHEKVKRYEK
jgi:hypothetical protein